MGLEKCRVAIEKLGVAIAEADVAAPGGAGGGEMQGVPLGQGHRPLDHFWRDRPH